MSIHELTSKLKVAEKLLEESEYSNSILRQELVQHERLVKALKQTESKYFEIVNRQNNEAMLNDRILELKKEVTSLTLKLSEFDSQMSLQSRQLGLTKDMLQKS